MGTQWWVPFLMHKKYKNLGGKFMSKTKKITLAGALIALGVIMSTFSIPIGITKCFPIQHLINVVAAVILGPLYGVSMAFLTSLIRVMAGTGTLLAFPGSMCGALLAGILYNHSKKIYMAYIGEIIGTGIIGALLAYPVAALILSKEAALLGFVVPFSVSSIGGATISLVFLFALKKTRILNERLIEG